MGTQEPAAQTGTAAQGRRLEVAAVARIVAVAVVALSSFVGLRLALHGGDPSIFVLAGEEVTDPSAAPADLTVAPGVRGYDGQAFYRLARNPSTRAPEEFGIEFSRPAYRHQRIVYPVLAWAVSGGGRAGLTPWALISVNLAAGALLAGIAARLALDSGRSAWLGLIPAAWSGHLIGLSLDLSEVVAGAALAAALLALRRSRWGLAAIAMAVGTLTRETTVIMAIAVLAAALLGHLPALRTRLQSRTPPVPGAERAGDIPTWVGLAPIAAYVGWRATLEWWWAGAPTSGEGIDFLTVPFLRLTERLATIATGPGSIDPSAVQLLLALAAVGIASWNLSDRRAGHLHERLALAAFLLLFVSSPVWELDVTFLRWGNDTVTVGWLLALSTSNARMRSLTIAVGVLWALTAAIWVPFP